jgi:hypothetical protein
VRSSSRGCWPCCRPWPGHKTQSPCTARRATTERDRVEAARLYERACQGGELVGCTNLGLLYEAGEGVPQDQARANGLYQIACEGGELLACDLVAQFVDSLRRSGPETLYTKVGRVGDAVTGEPLSDAIIEIPQLSVRAISDAQGRLQLPGLRAGSYLVTAQRAGYQLLNSEIEVPGNREFFVLLDKAEDVDPRAPGTLMGRVSEYGDRDLADVEVTVLGQPRARTLTNGSGRFTLRGVEPGLVEVRFARIGYAPRTATAIVHPERTTSISTELTTEPIELEPIEVTVRSRALEQSGFFDRMASGFGRQFTTEDIMEVEPTEFAEVLRGRVPGVRITYGMFGVAPQTNPGDPPALGPTSSNQAVAVARSTTGVPCVLSVWIDGVLDRSGIDINQIDPLQVEAVEVYTGIETPAQYSRGDRCGVILVWTRRGI